MFVQAFQATKEQVLQQINQFVTAYPDAFFYKETFTSFELAPVQNLTIDDLQAIRIFHQSAELKVKALRNGYQLVCFTPEPTENSLAINLIGSRTVLLDEIYVSTYKKLEIEIYHDDTLGHFERWKGVS